MKRILLIAAALIAVCSCSTEKPADDPVSPDKIQLSTDSATFEKEAGKVNVIVTSTSDWTLSSEEEYSWVEPSASAGSDGDIVTFKVAENLEADRTAVYSFKCGKAAADFTIVSVAGEAPRLVLTSEAEISRNYEEGVITVCVTCPTGYRKITHTLSEGADSWLHYQTTLAGEEETQAELKFVYDKIFSLDNREAVITVSAEGFEPIEVKFFQTAKQQIILEKEFYSVEIAGGDLLVPVQGNVEYEVSLNPASDWITFNGKSAEGLKFSVSALESGKRSVNVILTQTGVVEGTEPLSARFTVTQVSTLIEWAADMTNNRLFPKWVNSAPSQSALQVTLEALVKANEFTNEISTVMGVEGAFLLRFGDAGLSPNILQLATTDGNIALYDYPFEPNRWYHIACTFDSGTVKIYRDGELLIDSRCGAWSVPLGKPWSYEPTGSRCWWYGYSYNSARFFNGLMTELRIWSKVLTQEEINAPNHFYTVDPSSEGLSCYWQFTEGSGDTISDKSVSSGSAIGEPLYGELNIEEQYDGKDGRVNKGTPGIKWVPVSLPEK